MNLEHFAGMAQSAELQRETLQAPPLVVLAMNPKQAVQWIQL